MAMFRGLQRKFATIVFASVILFLIYLLLSNSGHLQTSSRSRPDPQGALHNSADSVVHMDRKPDNVILDAIARTTTKPPTSEKHSVHPDTKDKILNIPTKNSGIQAQDTKKDNGPDKNIGIDTIKDGSVLPPLATNLDNPYSGPRNREQQEIVSAFLHAWKYYKMYAWGHDELKPVSKGWQEWMGVGLTIVDSLDTMYIMGLKNEFAEAREWVATNLSFDKDHDVQLFEIVIRELGGLLAAYHLSDDKVFLDKAVELGNKLDKCFRGLTPIPCFRINFHSGRTIFGDISTAEVASVQVEYISLSRESGNQTYEKSAMAVSEHLHGLKKLDGLVSCFLNAHTGEFRTSSTVSVGASADSYYEYLLKQWLQTGKTKDWLKDDYLEAVQGIKSHLYRFTAKDRLGFVGSYLSMNSRSFRPDMEHLACFLPGTLALGYMAGIGGEEHLKMAENITHTCYQMYARSPTGLSPEVASMGISGTTKEDIYMSTSYSFNLQRPEAVESIFYMYRATKDPKYRRWGWEIFQAFEKYTKLAGGGYASISNVKNPDSPGFRDKMETFYLAETLKYLYLLFSDDPQLIPLDKFVINTEAHPLPVYTS